MNWDSIYIKVNLTYILHSEDLSSDIDVKNKLKQDKPC